MFLSAPMHLYMRLCPSVSRTVSRPNVPKIFALSEAGPGHKKSKYTKNKAGAIFDIWFFLNFFFFSNDRVLLCQKMFIEMVQSFWAKIWGSGK